MLVLQIYVLDLYLKEFNYGFAISTWENAVK